MINQKYSFKPGTPDKSGQKFLFWMSLLPAIYSYFYYLGLGRKYLSTCGSVGGSFGAIFLPFESLLVSLIVFLYVGLAGYVFFNIMMKRVNFKAILCYIIFVIATCYGSYFVFSIIKTYELTQNISKMMSPAEIHNALTLGPKRFKKYILVSIALNPYTAEETLDEISQSTDPELQGSLDCTVFNNLVPNMDRCIGVMTRVAQHKNVSSETLLRLAKSNDLSIIAIVVKNSNTPESIQQLWHKFGIVIAYEISDNPNTPTSILQEILSIKDYLNDHRLSCSLAKNPNTPTEVLYKLSYSKGPYSDWIKKALLSNPNLPKEILARLQIN